MLNEVVTTSIYDDVLPTVISQVSTGTIALARTLESLVEEWTGADWVQNIRVQNKTNGRSGIGMERWDLSATNNVRQLRWKIKGYTEPIVIPGIHKALAARAGNNKIIDIISEKLDEASESARANLARMFYDKGLGEDFDGYGVTIGNASDSTSYGEITRSSYSFMSSYVDTTSTAMTQALCLTAFDSASVAGDAKKAPTIGYTTSAIWRTLENTLASQLQAHYVATTIGGHDKVGGGTPRGKLVKEAELKGAFGVDAITVRARPVAADDACPSGIFFWVNENYHAFRNLQDPDLKSFSMNPRVEDVAGDLPKSPIQMRDWMKAIDQHGEVAALMIFGQLANKQPRLSSKLINKT